MFTLMVSRDAGMSYRQERESDDLTSLQDRMDELDAQMLRWHVDWNGETLIDPMCAIYKQIFASMVMVLEKEHDGP